MTEPIKLTPRESQIFEGIKMQHAHDIAVLQNKVNTLEANEKIHNENRQFLMQQVVDLQNKLLATQDRLTVLQDRLLSLRSIINAP